MVNLLRKSAFLLLLATGWRISELHACVRLIDFCRFTHDASLLLRPHECFLAKNERPYKRWNHKQISPLLLPGDVVSKLCPVSTLKEYLSRSEKGRTDALFQPICKETKPLTKHGLSTQICQLVLDADPQTKAKVHDIRKYASTYALTQTMLVGELQKAIGWSSPVTFFRHYLAACEPLKVNAVLPVLNPRVQN